MGWRPEAQGTPALDWGQPSRPLKERVPCAWACGRGIAGRGCIDPGEAGGTMEGEREGPPPWALGQEQAQRASEGVCVHVFACLRPCSGAGLSSWQGGIGGLVCCVLGPGSGESLWGPRVSWASSCPLGTQGPASPTCLTSGGVTGQPAGGGPELPPTEKRAEHSMALCGEGRAGDAHGRKPT